MKIIWPLLLVVMGTNLVTFAVALVLMLLPYCYYFEYENETDFNPFETNIKTDKTNA